MLSRLWKGLSVLKKGELILTLLFGFLTVVDFLTGHWIKAILFAISTTAFIWDAINRSVALENTEEQLQSLLTKVEELRAEEEAIVKQSAATKDQVQKATDVESDLKNL